MDNNRINNGFKGKNNLGGDYSQDNFDVENTQTFSKKKAENYDDSFETGSDDFENASLSNKQNKSSKVMSDIEQKTENDYGDDFESQTGEETKLNKSSKNSINRNHSGKNNSGFFKNLSKNKTVGIILTIAAVICLILAIVFAFSQCSDGSEAKKETTAPSTNATSAVSTTIAHNTTVYYYQEENENNPPEVVTNAPTTQEATEPPTTTENVTTTTAQETTQESPSTAPDSDDAEQKASDATSATGSDTGIDDEPEEPLFNNEETID